MELVSVHIHIPESKYRWQLVCINTALIEWIEQEDPDSDWPYYISKEEAENSYKQIADWEKKEYPTFDRWLDMNGKRFEYKVYYFYRNKSTKVFWITWSDRKKLLDTHIRVSGCIDT